AINARGLRWRGRAPDAPAVGADADFGFAGTVERWAAIGDARLARGRERASLQFDGRGDARQVRLRTLRAQTPGGTLDGQGSVAWSPRLAWTFDARLAGFDPGYFAPDWSGTLAGRVHTRGQARAGDGALEAVVDVPQLAGRLRGRALQARGRFSMRPGAQARSDYAGELAMTLGASRVEARGTLTQALSVDARFEPLRLDDLLPDARGTLRGTVRLRGARDAPDVEADLQGQGITVAGYAAERFEARGMLPWRAGDGRLLLRAQGLQAGVPFATLDVDARGAVERLRLQARAGGASGAIDLDGTLRRDRARWQGELATLRLAPSRGAAWRLRAPARFAWAGRALRLERACLASDAGGALCAQADWPRRGIDVDAVALPLALAEPWLPRETDDRAWRLHGELAFDAQLRPLGAGWRGEARARSAAGGVGLGARDLVRYRDLQLTARFTAQRLQATLGAALDGGGRLDADVATGWDAYAPLAGEIALRTDELTWLELFSPDLVDPRGRLDGRFALGGTRAQPRLGGSARLSGFTAELPALGIALHDGQLRMDAQPDGSARLDGSVRTGKGVLRVDGTLGWQGEAPLRLNLRGDDVLVADTRELRAVVDPDVQVAYRVGEPLRVTGTVAVPSARLDLERLDEGVGTSPDVVVLDPVDPERGEASALELDLALRLGEDVRMDGFGLEGRVEGELRVRARPGRETTALGRLDVDGRYTAYGQELEITRGRLIWSNGPVADPILDLRAEREVGDVTAGIRVTGRASAPQAEVWSDPATSQSEALAYLALGRPLSALSGSEGRQLDAASAALTAGGSLLAAQIGARIGLDDAGVMQSRALGGSVFGIGKYLSPRLYVGYGVSLLGTGQVLTLKYLLRRGFEIEIESSTLENRASVNWRRERGGPRSEDVRETD
ncbi:MAG TPA: translocation/assembly module TamB domain-containing protein, partial [Lysobacter sp.]|nr:translocation/assembly module TamB domain-containing protein [Lysobacter sp.]